MHVVLCFFSLDIIFQNVWVGSSPIHVYLKKKFLILYHNQINVRALISIQLWIIVPVNPWKFHLTSELLFKSN